MYGLKAHTIVGYTYNAETVCPDCMHDESLRLFRKAGGKVESISTEVNLDSAATYMGIDRYDERTFDTDDFPKVIFASQVEDDERCGHCGDSLIGL
jgi:hypothetical protein